MSNQIAFVTDTHQGARNSSKFFREHNAKYWRDEFFPEIKRREIKTILHLGDFFDSRNSVSLHDISYIMNEWLPLLEDSGAVMYVIAGNHDVAYRNTNAINSLALLQASSHVVVISDHPFIVDPFNGDGPKFVMCPWINNENFEEIMEDLKYYSDKEHILCLHGEFKGMKMYKNSTLCEHGLDPDNFSSFLKVFSGHFHHPSQYGNVEYIGSLFHFNWQDYGDWRGWMVYDNDEAEFESIENTSCPFVQHQFEDAKDWDDKELELAFSNRIGRIIVSEEYDRVEMKDLIHKIENKGPISIDIIDNTIIDRVLLESEEDEVDDNDVKEISQYVDEALADDPEKETLTALFKEIHEAAQEKMKEIE